MDGVMRQRGDTWGLSSCTHGVVLLAIQAGTMVLRPGMPLSLYGSKKVRMGAAEILRMGSKVWRRIVRGSWMLGSICYLILGDSTFESDWAVRAHAGTE